MRLSPLSVLKFLEGITASVVMQELQGRLGVVAHKAHSFGVCLCVGSALVARLESFLSATSALWKMCFVNSNIPKLAY